VGRRSTFRGYVSFREGTLYYILELTKKSLTKAHKHIPAVESMLGIEGFFVCKERSQRINTKKEHTKDITPICLIPAIPGGVELWRGVTG